MRTECFKCHRNYNSRDPNDEGGVDFCPKCRKESKKIARTIDAERKKRPKKPRAPKPKPYQTIEKPGGVEEIWHARQLLNL